MARFDAAEPDLLVLDYVVLDPKWRKLKLGLLAVRRLVDMIGGGCGLAVNLIGSLRRDAAKLLGVSKAWFRSCETNRTWRGGRRRGSG